MSLEIGRNVPIENWKKFKKNDPNYPKFTNTLRILLCFFDFVIIKAGNIESMNEVQQ